MKNQIVTLLKQRDDYISGEELGKALGISRAAVWKNIRKLKEEGYIIDSASNRGYRLISDGDILEESVFKEINTTIVGKKIYCFNKLDSTNDQAKTMAPSAAEGTVIIANNQLKGKGRMGRQWDSGSNNAVAMSIILKPELSISKAVHVTLLAGIAVAGALNKMGLEAQIKWPNDVIIGGKKVCGILTELSSDIGSANSLVVGIGINVNNDFFPEDIANKATSLLIETGVKYRRSALITMILETFDKLYIKFKKEGITPFIKKYKNLCINIGREVSVTYSNQTITGTAVDINESGELVIKCAQGELKTIYAGEVSVRGIYGYV